MTKEFRVQGDELPHGYDGAGRRRLADLLRVRSSDKSSHFENGCKAAGGRLRA